MNQAAEQAISERDRAVNALIAAHFAEPELAVRVQAFVVVLLGATEVRNDDNEAAIRIGGQS